MDLNVSEIFNSIQGEGAYIGVPATFVRFAGCNLDCSFCDSRYALKSTEGKLYSPVDLASKVVDYLLPKGIVVLTGGEPCMQDESSMYDFILELAKVAVNTGKGKPTIHVETNGSSFCNWFHLCAHVVVSPKAFTDLNIFEELWQSEVEASLKLIVRVDSRVASSIKVSFLNEAGELLHWDLPYILNQRQLHSLQEAFISPVAPIPFDLYAYLYRAKQLGSLLSTYSVGASLPYSVRLTLQTHKLMWGDIKGK